MSVEKSPAFQLYPRVLLADTQSLSDAAFGLYVRLLCTQWVEGSIPEEFESETDEAIVDLLPPAANMAERRKAWKTIRKHFKPHPTLPGRLAQSFMEKLRADKNAYHAKQAANSVLGVEARRRKRGLVPNGQPNGSPNGQPQDIPPVNRKDDQGDDQRFTSSSASESVSTETPPTPPTGGTAGGGTGRGEPSNAIKLGTWFFETGLALGAIDAHLAAVGPLDFAYRSLAACEVLLATYPLDEIQQRSRNLFARKLIASPDRILKKATPDFLAEHWTWFETAEPPQRRLAVVKPSRPEGAEDYDTIIARRSEIAAAARRNRVYTPEEQALMAEI